MCFGHNVSEHEINEVQKSALNNRVKFYLPYDIITGYHLYEGKIKRPPPKNAKELLLECTQKNTFSICKAKEEEKMRSKLKKEDPNTKHNIKLQNTKC